MSLRILHWGSHLEVYLTQTAHSLKTTENTVSMAFIEVFEGHKVWRIQSSRHKIQNLCLKSLITAVDSEIKLQVVTTTWALVQYNASQHKNLFLCTYIWSFNPHIFGFDPGFSLTGLGPEFNLFSYVLESTICIVHVIQIEVQVSLMQMNENTDCSNLSCLKIWNYS